MPKLYIISGCNGSGKTTASYTLLPDLLNCREFVNSDEFAKSFSPFDPGAASVTASRYMLMKINYLLERKADFAIETTLATRSLLQIVRQAQQQNYETTVLYFWLNSPELAIERVRDRVESGGHHIPDAVIRRRYVMGLQYLFDVYIPVIDRWILADNSKPPFSVVAEGSKDVTYIKDNEKYQLIQRIAHPNESL
ncbi:MAG: zeta toxin family protein [Bacteroidales bacterium]|nr:zeta toxin family protein [Bacteroidales bacterium]MDY6443838.1 zeta toxin family protein [Bacteroidales bacterium]